MPAITCLPGRPQRIKSFVLHQEPVSVYSQTFLGNALGSHRVDRLFGWFWSYLRRLNRQFDVTVVSSEWLAGRLLNFGLRRPLVLPLGVERNLFSPIRRDPAVRCQMLRACGISIDEATL